MDEAILSQLEGMMDDEGYINPEPEGDESEDEVDDVDQSADTGADDDVDDEPEASDDEETDEPDVEDSDQGDPDGGSDEDKLFDIRIGEDDYEVNLEELKTGYLRNEDLIARRTELESEYDERVSELEQTQQELLEELQRTAVFALGNANKYDQVNWQQLKQQDPEQYSKLRLEALEAKEQSDAILKRRNDVSLMAAKAQEIKQQARLQSQTKLAKELIPEMTTDPDFGKKLVAYGKQIGYTELEISSIDDARQLAVLNQARLYAESQVRRKEALEKKVTKELPPVMKPGAPRTTSSEMSKKTKQARQRLGNERSVDAAAAYFLQSGMV